MKWGLTEAYSYLVRLRLLYLERDTKIKSYNLRYWLAKFYEAHQKAANLHANDQPRRNTTDAAFEVKGILIDFLSERNGTFTPKEREIQGKHLSKLLKYGETYSILDKLFGPGVLALMVFNSDHR